MAGAQGEERGVPMWVSQTVLQLVLKHGVQDRAQQDMSRVVQIIQDGERSW